MAPTAVKQFESLDQFRERIHSGKVIFVDFWATWCGPCKMIAPTFERLAAANKSADVEFYKVDADKQSDIAKEVGIKAMPTFHVFKDGAKRDKSVVGAQPGALTTLVKEGTALAKIPSCCCCNKDP